MSRMSFTSELEVEASIRTVSQIATVSPLDVCKTWVFISQTREFIIDTDVFRTLVFNVALLFVSVLPSSIVGKNYAEHEQTADELLFPTYSGPMRHSAQCQIVSVLCFAMDSRRITDALSHQRIIRPQKDYFIFYGHSVQLSLLDHLRHKFRFAFDHMRNLIQVEDSCLEQKTHSPSLFTLKCDRILHGKSMRVRAMLGRCYVRFDKAEKANEKGGGSGLFYDILKSCAENFNFTFSLQTSDHGGASGFKKNGRWYGTVGEVFHHEADLGIAIGMTATRDGAIDNGISFEENKRVFFIKERKLRSSWKAILAPFQPQVWFCIICAAILIIPVYYFSLKLDLAITAELYRVVFSRGVLTEIVVSLIKILFEQSSTQGKKFGTRIRCVIILWVTFSLIMGAGFRSRLIFFLTVVGTDVQVPATHEALVATNYKILFRNYGGIAYKFTKDSQDPVQMKIFNRAILYNTSQECIIAAMVIENSACLDWEVHGSYAVATNATIHPHQAKSLLIKSKDSVLTTMLTWVYRKRSPWRDTFDAYLLRILASGLYVKWGTDDWRQGKIEGAKWLHRQTDSPINGKLLDAFKEFGTSPKPLALASIYGILCLLLMGFFAGIVVCVTEKRKRREEENIKWSLQNSVNWYNVWIGKVASRNSKKIYIRSEVAGLKQSINETNETRSPRLE